jgi:ABC-type multidrug transport system fused ATPase/permease subunit
MEKFKIFIQLTRLNKPIGFLLLFWPCVWGLTLSYYFSGETALYLKHIILFFLGSVMMRSAGCIFNDIVDKDFDKKVQRTKERPIASGKISVLNSLFIAIFLCLFAFIVLLQFNLLTIILGMCSMIFAFAYPFMKRITYWPQTKAKIIEHIPKIIVSKLNCKSTIKANKQRKIAINSEFKTDIFPDAIGLSFVLCTFLSKSLSTISLKIQPALRIITEPKKNNIICFKYKAVSPLK